MSASVWEPGSNIVNIDAESTNLSQVFSATAAQVTFTLTLFTYTVGAASIAVYRGGQRLIKGVDWSEVDSTHFSITGISLDAGEVIECVAVLGASSANSLASAASAAAASASASAASASQIAANNSAIAAAASASAATFPWTPESGGIYYAGGNVRLGAAGARITGDFSNATVANRVMFQTSTVNSITSLNAVPNGTGVGSEVVLFSNVDPSNSSYAAMTTDNTAMTVIAGKTGTGTYLPLRFITSGSERLRIDTGGNVGIGRAPSYKLDVYAASGAVISQVGVSGSTGTDIAQHQCVASSTTLTNYAYGSGFCYTLANCTTSYTFGTITTAPTVLVNNNTEVARLDSTWKIKSIVTSKAWVNFDGSLTGTITPRASFNVTSLTKNSTGDYTVNFTNAMTDANYTASGICASLNIANHAVMNIHTAATSLPTLKSTTQLRIQTYGAQTTLSDLKEVNLQVSGN